MSAWIVDREHVDILVALGLKGAADSEGRWRPLVWYPSAIGRSFESYEQAARDEAVRDGFDPSAIDARARARDLVGRMLWTENLASVAHRYPSEPDGGLPGPCGLTAAEIADYSYRAPICHVSLAEAFKALDCFEYQSCERDDWQKSEAHAYCEALRNALSRTLPGYDAAPWGWTAEESRKRSHVRPMGLR